jgi:hypothetical protein
MAPRLRDVGVRVKYHVRTSPGGPANSFRVAPTFVADYDAESQKSSKPSVAQRSQCSL